METFDSVSTLHRLMSARQDNGRAIELILMDGRDPTIQHHSLG